jgi:ribonuclease D
MSNWAADNLTPAQIKYAATDAWVSREIHARALSALPAEGAA